MREHEAILHDLMVRLQMGPVTGTVPGRYPVACWKRAILQHLGAGLLPPVDAPEQLWWINIIEVATEALLR